MTEKTEKLVIIGDGAFAEIAYEYFTYDSKYEVVAFSIDRDYIKRDSLFGIPVIPFDELDRLYPPDRYKIYTALVYNQLNRLRTRFYSEAKAKGYQFASYISSKAFLWRNVEIGENCFIFENNVIQPFVHIGNNVILWSGNHIGHHSKIKDNVFISSHVVLSGFCEVEEYCFLGVNATIANNVVVKKDCLIGAGASILKNTEENKLYGVKMTPPSPLSALKYFKVEDEN